MINHHNLIRNVARLRDFQTRGNPQNFYHTKRDRHVTALLGLALIIV
jgi:hypothetical protein